MVIKHIFSDMDGTLLNSTGGLNQNNIDMIRRCELPFTLVSARAPMEMAFAIEALQLASTHIAFNGGLIFEQQSTGKKVISESYIAAPTAQILIEQIQQHFPAVSLSFYDLDYWYTGNVDRGIRFEQSLTHQIPQLIRYTNFFNRQQQKVFKIMLITFDKQEMQDLHGFLRGLGLPGISIQQSGATYLEITAAQAKKSKGIRYIMDHEQLSKNEVAAFGDGHNDLPMLEMVGLPIVMANALPEIKAVGRHITKSNVEDGVGYGIEHFLK